MKRHIKTLIFSFCFILSVLLPITACAADYTNGYTLSSYDINIEVNKDNTLSVTENITADFYVPKHGIYRYIPTVNQVKQSDGSYKRVKCAVKNVKAEDIYDQYTSDDNYVIQIGDSDKTVIGEKNYTISYTYDMGRDINDGFDALYFNLIGTGWDTSIDNVTFTITMPDSNFSEDKLSFYTGEYGDESQDSVEYNVNGNVITGKVNKTLYPSEALTVTLFLDDGYFTFDYKTYYAKLAATVGFPLLALIIVLILWTKFGRDKKLIDVVEFYPPEGLNSAEVALWYKGNLSREDTIGLLIELANEGYIDIVEESKASRLRKAPIKIRKTRSAYTGDDEMKEVFFNGLFVGGTSVYADDLKDSFYKTIDRVDDIAQLSLKQVFNQKSLILRFVGWCVSALSIFLCIKIASSGLSDEYNLITAIIGVIIGVAAFGLSFFIRQRSDKGHELKQKINGFKLFLETAEKEKLELLVEENPRYFYNILPYAYVLGVSDKWIKKFESIAMEKPRWYYGDSFSPMTMYYLMHNQIPDFSRAMVSVPQSSSSGGGFSSGGGGFSGGGFGGGGGSSW